MNTYDPTAGIAISFAIIAVLLVGYFIPTVVAVARRHRNVVPVALINLFFGWSVLGWLIALIWAFTADVYPPAAKA